MATADILDMNCDDGLDLLANKFGIDVNKVKSKCAAGQIGMFLDLDSLSDDELKNDLLIQVGLKIKIREAIQQAKIIRQNNSPAGIQAAAAALAAVAAEAAAAA